MNRKKIRIFASCISELFRESMQLKVCCSQAWWHILELPALKEPEAGVRGYTGLHSETLF
jgi:hypothetical protein